MRFAEVFLRLGSALVGWMLIYAHALWLAILHIVGCGPDDDAFHKLLLGISILTMGGAIAIHSTKHMPEVHGMLRWLALPLIVLLPWVAISIWEILAAVNLGDSSICSAGSPASWQIAWAPVQLMVTVVVAWSCFRIWQAFSTSN